MKMTRDDTERIMSLIVIIEQTLDNLKAIMNNTEHDNSEDDQINFTTGLERMQYFKLINARVYNAMLRASYRAKIDYQEWNDLRIRKHIYAPNTQFSNLLFSDAISIILKDKKWDDKFPGIGKESKKDFERAIDYYKTNRLDLIRT